MRKEVRENGKGRPPNDAVLMFKTLVLRELHQLSDDSMEYYILDRLSFQQFLDLNFCADVLDAKSIWHYREQLTQERYRCPMDKNKKSYFGYKNHIKVDAKSKTNKKLHCQQREVHDSVECEDLLDEMGKGQQVSADSAYRSEEIEKMIEKKHMKSQIHQRAYRNKPLRDEEKADNREKSRVRSRVEHVFGFMKTSMKTDKLRAIGKVRIEGIIGLLNISYNMCRCVHLRKSSG